MPSHKPMKTYMKKTRIRMNTSANSVDAVNALFAENLTKRFKSRKKSKIKLKELPPQRQTQLSDDSLKVETNNTFDKLLKGKVYNEVKVVCNIVKLNTSNSDSSKHVSMSYHSPMMTRRRKKSSVVVPEVSDSTKPAQKTSTLDNVTKSISIEKENKHNISSLSFIKLPKITEDQVMDNIGKVFSDTFRERASVHSSTPYINTRSSKIVVDAISPIAINTRSSKIIADAISPVAKSDSSSSSELIRKSFDQIAKWDESFPLERTPQAKPRGKGRPRKLSTGNTLKHKDWKLNGSVKVWLEDCLRKPKSKSRKSSDGDLRVLENCLEKPSRKSRKKFVSGGDFKGFDCEEQTSCNKKHEDFSNSVLEYSRVETPVKRKNSDADLTDLRGFTVDEQASSQEYSTECYNSFISYNSGYLKRKQRLPSWKTKNPRNTPGRNRKPLNITNRGKFRSIRKKRIKSVTKTRETRSSKKDAKPSVKEKLFGTKTPRKRQLFVTLRRLPSAKKSQAANSRKSKMKKSLCFDVTDDILSEKEMSYSNSASFDFSSSSSKVQIEELKDEELSLPKSNVITVDLDEFDKFMQSYYLEDKAPSSSVITISDNDTCDVKSEVKPITIKSEEVSIEPNSNSFNNRSLDFLISPKKSNLNLTNTSGGSKIVILSDITLGVNNKPLEEINMSLNNICHDHTYSNTPPRLPSQRESPKQPPCSILEPDVDLSDIIESSTIEEQQNNNPKKVQKKPTKSLKLKPGKSYRRSLSLLRRSSVLVDVNVVCPEDCVCFKCMFKEKLNLDNSRKSQIVPVARKSLRRTILESYARSSLGYVQEQEENNFVDDLDGSLQNLRHLSLNVRKSIVGSDFEVTAKDVVLRRCGQGEVLGFEECFPTSALQNCHKIGEGVYGEVFLYRNANGGTSVMKIIPIEGDLIVNGERQKKFEEILSEIAIAMELSNLRNNKKNFTTCFSEVQKVRCTQGNYPDRLVDLWQLYDETKGSENDSPQMFPSDQMYIVLELANGGRDLESFVFNNAVQAYSMFKQTACALAVAENELKFEHRDLHWGNVLLTTVDKDKSLRFRLDGKEVEVETFGVEVAIIDFTLSRIEFDGVIIFNDLSLDTDLFVAKGDYQFEIYRLMQKSNGNEWQHFEPYTNILWLHYILDKVTELRYKNVKSKLHKNYLASLSKLKQEVLSYNTVTDFVKEKFF